MIVVCGTMVVLRFLQRRRNIAGVALAIPILINIRVVGRRRGIVRASYRTV